jgi:hypothetical protein
MRREINCARKFYIFIMLRRDFSEMPGLEDKRSDLIIESSKVFDERMISRRRGLYRLLLRRIITDCSSLTILGSAELF